MKARSFYLCGTALALGCPASAMAQDATPPAADAQGGLEEIVVTARRVEENQQKVPLAITTLTAAALERKNVTSVTDIQYSVPNLQIRPGQTTPSAPEFIIRGQRQVSYTDENVVTYVNGVPQTTRGLTLYDLDSVQALKGPQGTLFGKNSLGGAMVFTTKRPTFKTEGQLTGEIGNYNRRQLTGVLNVPLVDDKAAMRVAGQIERQRGFFKNFNPGFKNLDNRHNESGRVTLLLTPDDRLENVTTLDYLRRNEVPTPAIIEAAPAGADATNFFRSVTGQAVTIQSALAGATPIFVPTISATNGVLVRQGSPFVSVGQTGVGPTLPGYYFFNGARVEGAPKPLSSYGTRGKSYGLANTTSYTLSDVITLKNILGLRYERSFDYQDPSGLSGQLLDFSALLGAPISGFATNNDTYSYRRQKTVSDEFQIVGTMTDFKFIAGGFFSYQTRKYTDNSSFVVGPVSFYGPAFTNHFNMRDTARSIAAFAQGTYDFSGVGIDGLRLTGGLRYTKDRRRMEFQKYGTTNTDIIQPFDAGAGDVCAVVNGTVGNAVGVNSGSTCLQTNHRVYKALTWTASLEYQATPDTLLYFANRRGFKSGGPNFSTIVLQYSLFGPEQLTDFELGIKQQGRIGGMSYRVNAAGFIGKYKKIQTQDILQFCTNPAANPADPAACGNITDLIVLNVGQATIKGVEIEAALKPVPQLELSVGYSYQVGRYGKGSFVPQPTNPALPVANSNPINFAGGVDLTGVEFAGVPRTTLNASAILNMDFVPESFAKTTLSVNYFYRSKTKGLAVQGTYPTPSFHTLGARLSFNDLFGSPFSVAIWGQNITNEYYRLRCDDNLNSIGYAACKWGPPRTYGLTASVRF